MATSTTDYDFIVSLILLFAAFHHAIHTSTRFWLLPYAFSETIIRPVLGHFGIVDYSSISARFGDLLGASAPYLRPMSYCFASAWMVLFVPAAAYTVAAW